MKPPISLVLITDGICNSKCPSCPTGRDDIYRPRHMKVEMAEKILDKAMADSRIIDVTLCAFNEPFLHPQIVELAKLCRKRNLRFMLSTNLACTNFERVVYVLREEPALLEISVSGWSQFIQSRSHKGCDLQLVKNRMKEIAAMRSPKTHVRVLFHRYNYNRHEMEPFRNFAEDLGLDFKAYEASLLPLDRVLECWEKGRVDREEEFLITKLPAAKTQCMERRRWPCLLKNQVIAVDSDGMVMNCSARYSLENHRGSFLTRSTKEILKARQNDATCLACKKVGGHIYAAQAYDRKRFSPLRIAENIYRRLKLQGLSPKFSDWCQRKFFVRPGVGK